MTDLTPKDIQKVKVIKTEHLAAHDTIVEIDGTPSLEEWQQFGLMLKMAEKCVQWYLGYWWNYGHKKWSRDAEKFINKLGYEKSTLMVYGSVSNSVKLLTRVKDLSFKHHQIVAPFEEPEQKQWLKKAIDGDWTVARLRQKIKGTSEFEPKIYDIWNFQGIDDRFGQEYPGNIPAGIVLNTLYYYTKEDDLVVDPMAGGGVTIDCCKYLNRKYLAYDIEPTRKDIKQNNILQGYPSKTKGCSLIFLDPPYYKKKEKDYGDKSISALTIEQYWIAFEKIAKHSYQCIKKGGFLALLMEPYVDYQDSSNSLWLYQYIDKFIENKWQVERIFDVPESSQRYAAHDVAKAKEEKQILTLRRQLVIFRK